MNHRRLTPSMSLLLAFEAAARHESYTRAADELALSQSAVSRQVLTLEQQLGVSLFRREGRSVRLTDVGRRYYLEIRDALGRIRGATLQVTSYKSGLGSLHLATLPTFGSKWLLPRLNDFYAKHPGVLVHIHSRIGDLGFENGQIDAAITVGTGDWPDLVARPLLNESLIAITGPDQTAKDAAWVEKQTLLTVANNPHAWSEWFSAQELDHRRMRLGPSFELTSHLIQAVRTGLGVGLVPRALVEDELQHGQLRAIGEAIPSRRSYYLTYPLRNASLPSLVTFEAWLLATCAGQDNPPIAP